MRLVRVFHPERARSERHCHPRLPLAGASLDGLHDKNPHVAGAQRSMLKQRRDDWVDASLPFSTDRCSLSR